MEDEEVAERKPELADADPAYWSIYPSEVGDVIVWQGEEIARLRRELDEANRRVRRERASYEATLETLRDVRRELEGARAKSDTWKGRALTWAPTAKIREWEAIEGVERDAAREAGGTPEGEHCLRHGVYGCPSLECAREAEGKGDG